MHATSKLHIKGMVCQRCINTIHDELTAIGLQPARISLGEIIFDDMGQTLEKSRIEQALHVHGFSLLEDRNEKMISEVKKLVSRTYDGEFDFPYQFRFSHLLATHFNKDYDYISSLFSSYERVTIEKYVISYRIEKVKEFLVYTSLSLEDIAFRLGFSSAPHLSRQFKSVTGMNPSQFRSIRQAKHQISATADTA
jgi:AraC family transcriptional regulator